MEINEPAFVLYASDHGENLNDYGDGNFGHGTRGFTRFEFEIPFIIFFNDPFIRTFPEQVKLLRQKKDVPVNQDSISHTLLGLAGIRDKNYYRPDHDLSSDKFKTHKRLIIDENMNIYEYDALHLERRPLKSDRKK
jgi:heptose-I-phosphate ethanolaminephosphotransferase